MTPDQHPIHRGPDLSRATWLSVVSVLLGAAAAVFAIVFGLSSGSLSMIGFGLDAAIDASASVVLIWRFRIEVSNAHRGARAEHIAERLVGAVLVVSATALVLGAVRSLLLHEEPSASLAQTALLVLSIAALPPLSIAKRRVAIRLGSAALRRDALLTGAAAVLAFVALAAGQLAPAIGLWWADAAGSIVIAVVLGREGLLVFTD